MEDVLSQIAEATGLPSHLVMGELKELILKSGKDVNAMTMDDLRVLLADYLQDVILKAKLDFQE